MIKYEADELLRPTIKIVECEKETGSFVFINGQRRVKKSDFKGYFDSFDEAKAWLMARAEDRLSRARIALQQAQDRLGNIKGLKEPQA